MSAAFRPTVRATVLVAVGAAATLGATLLLEGSRPAASLGNATEWQQRAQMIDPAKPVHSVKEGPAIAKSAPEAATTTHRTANAQVFPIAGSVTLGGKGLADASIFAIPANAPEIQNLESNTGVTVDAILRNAIRVKSDGDGKFALQPKESCDHVILAFSDSAAPCFAKAAAGANEIVLTANAGSKAVGTVTDAKNNPIPKAQVVAIRPRNEGIESNWPIERKIAFVAFHHNCETDAAGAFSIAGLDDGKYVLMVSAPDFSTVKVFHDTNEPTTHTVALQAPAAVTGIVCDSQQKPIANATVSFQRIAPNTDREESDDVATDLRGFYATNRVSSGGRALVMKIAANGFAVRQMEIAPLVAGERKTQNIILDAAQNLDIRVVNEKGDPISNAYVEPQQLEDGAFVGVSTTDHDGIVHFGSAAAGRHYRVLAMATGYCEKIVGDITTREVNEIRLVRERALDVKIASAEGPVEGAQVQLTLQSEFAYLSDGIDGQVSNSKGICSFKGLSDGVYAVSVTAPGFAHHKSATLSLKEGTNQFSVTLDKGQVWTGRVVSPNGEPISNATVRIANSAEGNEKSPRVSSISATSVKTDAAGNFKFENVPSFAKYLVLSKPGSARRVVAPKSQTSEGNQINVGDLVFANGGNIAGKLLDSFGVPLPGESLTLIGTQLSGGAAPRAVTNPDGTFQFQGVVAGTYSLDSQSVAGAHWTMGLSRISTEVVVEEGKTTELLLDGRRNGRVYGQVRVKGTIPSMPLEVVLRKPGAVVAEVAATRVGIHGAYELAVPAAGKYLIEVVSMEGPAIRAARLVTLANQENRAIDLEIGFATISGIVRSQESNAGLANATIKLETEDGSVWTVRSGANGQFKMEGLPAAQAWISAQLDGYSTSKTQQISFANSRPATVELVLSRSSELVVRAIAPSVGPVSGARVHLWSEKGQHVAEATTDARGEATWDALPAARYAITIEHAQFEGFHPHADLAAGQRTEESVELRKTGSVEITFKSKTGESFAQTQVSVTTSTGLVRTLPADAMGIVRFDAVAEGKAIVKVAGIADQSIAVRANELTQITIEK
jgi:hypothetical protein